MEHTTDIIKQFKTSYQNFSRDQVFKLLQLYSNDVVFTDPIHKLEGIDQLGHYFSSISANLTSCRFEFEDQLIADESAYIKWVMFFRHPKLSKDVISVRGVTHLMFDEKIYFHEDLYDLGSMLYDHIPLLGRGTRFLKSRLSRKNAKD